MEHDVVRPEHDVLALWVLPRVSARGVARIERGEVEPRAATIKKLAETLGVEPDEIASY